MLDVGFSEILLTSAIALIVLGPERLPKVARQVGNWMGRARAMARQLSEQLEREVSADELLKTQSKPNTPSIAPPPPPLVAAPEPVHGLDAASTTAAAMHASDPPAADPEPAGPSATDTNAPATDAKSPP
jgi:sec-independent protein translocase protein TatB